MKLTEAGIKTETGGEVVKLACDQVANTAHGVCARMVLGLVKWNVNIMYELFCCFFLLPIMSVTLSHVQFRSVQCYIFTVVFDHRGCV